ncbi:hypothetical protein A2572_04805 [Candidatus Collierbacteria bacterium RIFOXYD1_FULL_40_9]|uniref:Uncharacterized protein n=1 Tax=Candidatus Collierbacteria bacterium RIFOXYD1_FULL_40_9 TaxID=1817731 RepID=A0A1F5FVF1_9BACT|nr:MAG: hypothetical protein A2572_04805 [Candidatus Collierbacteria bacterium RIFOXYD1_FULL_40_9]
MKSENNKKSYLITGVSGSGKSTVCKELKKRNFEAHDVEDIDGLFEMYHKGTNKIFEEYDNANPEHIKGAEWNCDIDKLKKLIVAQKSEIAFYCGIASNMNEVVGLFDKFFVLKSSKVSLNNRLKNREGTDDIGNNQKGRDVVLGWKDWWEEEMQKQGGILIEANDSSENITNDILGMI